MSAESFDVVGIDLGGTKLFAGLVGPDGAVRDTERIPVAGLDEAGLVDALARATTALADRSHAGVAAVGMGIPTTIDRRTGVAVAACNLPIDDLDVAGAVRARTGIPAVIDNDATVAALAEARVGVGRGSQHLVMLTLGTGVGGGMILDGRPYSGAVGGGSELGHVILDRDGPECVAPNCPNRGCIETFCSGSALARDAQAIAAQFPDSALGLRLRESGAVRGEDVVELARAGDTDARTLLDQLAIYLGESMVTLVNIFNPEVLVIGGGLADGAAEWIFEPARRIVGERALPPGRDMVRIEPAALGNSAGVVGAAMLARDHAAAVVGA